MELKSEIYTNDDLKSPLEVERKNSITDQIKKEEDGFDKEWAKAIPLEEARQTLLNHVRSLWKK